MRILSVIIFMLTVSVMFAQSSVNYQNCSTELVKPYYPPAPCSIQGQGVATELFLIQVGAYREQVNPKPGTVMMPFRVVNLETGEETIMYRYYVAAIFPSRIEADTFLIDQHIRQDFCDALVVPFPFTGVMGYK